MAGRLVGYLRVHALDVFSGVQGSALWTPALRRVLFRMAGYRLGRRARMGARSHLGRQPIETILVYRLDDDPDTKAGSRPMQVSAYV